MYPEYENTKEGRAREALEHPDGEEFPGSHDSYKQDLRDAGWDERDVEERYGKSHNRGM